MVVKLKNRILFHDVKVTQNSNPSVPKVFFNTVTLDGVQCTCGCFCTVTAALSSCDKDIWPAEPKMFTIWPVAEHVYQPLAMCSVSQTSLCRWITWVSCHIHYRLWVRRSGPGTLHPDKLPDKAKATGPCIALGFVRAQAFKGGEGAGRGVL